MPLSFIGALFLYVVVAQVGGFHPRPSHFFYLSGSGGIRALVDGQGESPARQKPMLTTAPFPPCRRVHGVHSAFLL
jgi:hypothetical protein